MGKTLIIKGADFSKVAVETACVDGRYNLTKNNFYKSSQTYIVDGNDTWGVDNTYANAALYFIADKDEMITIKANAKGKVGLALVKEIGIAGNPVVYADHCIYDILHPNNTAILRVRENCLLYVMNGTGGQDRFPSEIYKTKDYEANRTLTKTNYIKSGQGYVSSSKTWGDGTVPETGLYYPVFYGEHVHITANNTQNAYIAFVKYSDVETGEARFIQGTSRQIIQKGTTQDIIVPTDCQLWVYNRDLETDIFPSSLIISNI